MQEDIKRVIKITLLFPTEIILHLVIYHSILDNSSIYLPTYLSPIYLFFFFFFEREEGGAERESESLKQAASLAGNEM